MMNLLRRLFGVSIVALLAGLVGVGVGLLVAPASGSDTRAWLAGKVEKHGPTVKQNIQKAGSSVGDAAEFVAAQVEAVTDND
jgi:gas vesicle protein